MGDEVVEPEAIEAGYLKELHIVRDPSDRVVPSDELRAAIEKLSGPSKELFTRLLSTGFFSLLQR